MLALLSKTHKRIQPLFQTELNTDVNCTEVLACNLPANLAKRRLLRYSQTLINRIYKTVKFILE